MKLYNSFKYIAYCCLFVFETSCHNHQKDSGLDAQVIISGDTVSIQSNSSILSKISLKTVSPQDYTSQSVTTGTVKPLSGHLAEVSTPFEGRIVKSYVKLGEMISSGTPLYEVSSSEYFDAVKAFLQAKQSKMLSEKNFQRKKDLTEHGVGSKKEFEEAESELNIAEKEFDKTEATLRIFNVNADNIDMSKPLIVRSPISGEVVKNTITVGQYLKSDAEPVITVADLNKIWVVARVKEKNIGQINRQDRVEVFTESYPDKPIRGFVDYIGNIMDEQTRSVEVYVECENHDKILKPGMFVTTSFEHKRSNAIILPASAVLQQEDKSFVFLQINKNKFVKKQIIVSSNGDKNLIVHSGIETGNVIVTEGGIYLH